MSDDHTARPKYVFILVHGTFARDADWVNDPQSPLRQRLEKLGDVEFEIFKWTGGNTDADRFAGAEDLQQAIRPVVQQSPGAKHFIIGHSHGGNVILRALDGFSDAAHIDGVVTLATPFINCQPRDLDQLMKKLRGGAMVLLALVALAFHIWGHDPVAGGLKWMLPQVTEWPAIVTTATVLVWLAVASYLWLKVFSKTGPVQAQAKARQEQILAEFDQPGDIAVPFLSVATNYDEAAIVLGAGTKLAGMILWLDWILKPIVFLLWLMIVGFGWWTWKEEDDGLQFVLGLLTVVLLALQFVLSALRTAVTGFGFGFRGLIRSVIFGSGGMTRNALVEFRTTREPAGVQDQLCSICPVVVNLRGMRHSAVYTTPEILNQVADWITSRADSAQAQPAS